MAQLPEDVEPGDPDHAPEHHGELHRLHNLLDGLTKANVDALAVVVAALQAQVGTAGATPTGIEAELAAIPGFYEQNGEPLAAVAGDLWFDTDENLLPPGVSLIAPPTTFISYWFPPYATVGFTSLVGHGNSGVGIDNDPNTVSPYRGSSGTQNDYVSTKVFLGAGTWAFDLHYHENNNMGIAHLLLDNTEVGTIDLYAAALGYDQVKSAINVTVGATGVKTFKLSMSTKNGSASGYNAALVSGQWRQTT